jgi:hypothetical protein
MIGARYEITVDGAPRTNRDRRELAIEAGEYLKRRNPNSEVTVRDRMTGAVELIKQPPPLTSWPRGRSPNT